MVADIVRVPGFRTVMGDQHGLYSGLRSNHHVYRGHAIIAPCSRLLTLFLFFRGRDMNGAGDTGIKGVDRSEFSIMDAMF